MKFSGELFTYDEDANRTAFESEPVNSDKVVVFINGIGEGYNAVPYLEPLQKMLSHKNWSLVQVQLGSFGDGYGTSSLQKDSEQLDILVHHLKTKRNKKIIFFLGHSTGSQDCYWHNKYGKASKDISGYILQAPVSDRENLEKHLETFHTYLDMAIEMRKKNKGDELLPIQAIGTPITANRYYSFCAKGGDDDVFSTDLTEEEIKVLYTNVNRPMCWVYSADDECYASKLDPVEVMQRYQRICPAIVETHSVPNADHAITKEDAQATFCQIVENFLDSIQ